MDGNNGTTIIVMSGDLDKVFAAFSIAIGAAAAGKETNMYFTFWGIKAIQKGNLTGQSLLGKMMGLLNRGGINRIGPSRFNFGGIGRWMFKKMMKEKGAASLEELYQIAVELDVKMMPCDMTMQMMEYGMETMRDNVTEPVGVAAFIQEAAESKITLFI